MIDGIKRKSRIFVGDPIVRTTDPRLSQGEDVCSLSSGSKDRACDGKYRAGHAR